MNTRTALTLLGLLTVLTLPSTTLAQTADGASTVAPPVAQEHNHAAPAPAQSDRQGCCGGMMGHHESPAAAAAPAPHDEHAAASPDEHAPAQDTATESTHGCCSAMMKGDKQNPAAMNESAKPAEHSCCCSGMKK